MKRKTKQFLAAALTACMIGAVSMPVSAASDFRSDSLKNDEFFAQVRNVISDYWQEDYGKEIQFTSGEIGAKVDGETVGDRIRCEVNPDGDFLISAETFAEVVGEPPVLSSNHELSLVVQSSETVISGADYGAVQTIEDEGRYVFSDI